MLRFEVRLLTELHRYHEADSMLAGYVPVADPGEVAAYHLRRAKLNSLAGDYERSLELLGQKDSADPKLLARSRRGRHEEALLQEQLFLFLGRFYFRLHLSKFFFVIISHQLPDLSDVIFCIFSRQFLIVVWFKPNSSAISEIPSGKENL